MLGMDILQNLRRIRRVTGHKVGLVLTQIHIYLTSLILHPIVKYLLQEELVVEDIALHTTKMVIKQRD